MAIDNLTMNQIDMSLLRLADCFNMSHPQYRRLSAVLLRKFYLMAIQRLGGAAVFEIGAFEASFSRQVKAECLPNARIFAFEANPRVFEHFKPQMALNCGIEYLNLAVADYNGEIEFEIVTTMHGKPTQNAQVNSIMPRTDEYECEKVKVPCVTIDDFIKQQGVSGQFHAWIDVQGACEKVFAGMSKTLKNFATLFVEVEDFPLWQGQWLWRDVLQFMLNQGFYPIWRDFERNGQHNVVFVREDFLQNTLLRNLIEEYGFKVKTFRLNVQPAEEKKAQSIPHNVKK